MTKIITIAIDGPAASGKGTLAKNLASHYDFACLQTGMLYRALAAQILKSGGVPDDIAFSQKVAEHIDWDQAQTGDLHHSEIGEAASILAVQPEIRAILVAYQRDFAAHPPLGKKGAILDGRDIGTVILPDADVKFYLTASPETRIKRRQAQFARKTPTDRAQDGYQDIAREIHERDRRDQARAVSPLVRADDAHLLDTTKLSIEVAYSQAVKIIGDVCAAQGVDI